MRSTFAYSSLPGSNAQQRQNRMHTNMNASYILHTYYLLGRLSFVWTIQWLVNFLKQSNFSIPFFVFLLFFTALIILLLIGGLTNGNSIKLAYFQTFSRHLRKLRRFFRFDVISSLFSLNQIFHYAIDSIMYFINFALEIFGLKYSGVLRFVLLQNAQILFVNIFENTNNHRFIKSNVFESSNSVLRKVSKRRSLFCVDQRTNSHRRIIFIQSFAIFLLLCTSPLTKILSEKAETPNQDSLKIEKPKALGDFNNLNDERKLENIDNDSNLKNEIESNNSNKNLGHRTQHHHHKQFEFLFFKFSESSAGTISLILSSLMQYFIRKRQQRISQFKKSLDNTISQKTISNKFNDEYHQNTSNPVIDITDFKNLLLKLCFGAISAFFIAIFVDVFNNNEEKISETSKLIVKTVQWPSKSFFVSFFAILFSSLFLVVLPNILDLVNIGKKLDYLKRSKSYRLRLDLVAGICMIVFLSIFSNWTLSSYNQTNFFNFSSKEIKQAIVGTILPTLLILYATFCLNIDEIGIKQNYDKYRLNDKGKNTRLNILKGHARVLQRHVREDKKSRRILIFLSMNFSFMFVEFLYGFLTNSLGLISDACHMMFDCLALVIGLYSSYISKMQVDSSFTYGYGRFKVLSGFINGMLLVFIAISVFIEAIERILDPPVIDSHSLLLVSVIGFLFNLVGIFFFHQEHSHHGHDGHCHAHHNHTSNNVHIHTHVHTHPIVDQMIHNTTGHHHSSQKLDTEKHDPNIEGIFLHVLADTLGSAGVIVSSLLIHYFGWTFADALCSIFISALIFLAVYHLLRESIQILLQKSPFDSQLVTDELNRIVSMKGIIGWRDAHFWELTPGKIVGSLHLQIDETVNHSDAIRIVGKQLENRLKVSILTLQIEKESFLANSDPSLRMNFYLHSVSSCQKLSDDTQKIDLDKHHESNKHDNTDIVTDALVSESDFIV